MITSAPSGITTHTLIIGFANPKIASKQLTCHHSTTLTRHIEGSARNVATHVSIEIQTGHGPIVDQAEVIAFSSNNLGEEALLAWPGRTPESCVVARATRMLSTWAVDQTVAACDKPVRHLQPQDVRYMAYILGAQE